MNDTLFGELKIFLYVMQIPLHASDAARSQRTKRVALQTIHCYYVDRKETFERFKDANPNIDPKDLWAEFRYNELLD